MLTIEHTHWIVRMKTLVRLAPLPAVLPGGERYIDRLSSREREVLDLIYDGATNKAIAIKLDISIKTVEKHRGRIMAKMEVRNFAALIRLTFRETEVTGIPATHSAAPTAILDS